MTDKTDKPMTLISFGEMLWDVIEGQPHLGGAALNLAAHAACLGMHARLISCVGNDDLGHQALCEAARLGVDATGIRLNPTYPTGTVLVELVGGQPDYTIRGPVAWDFIPEVPNALSGASGRSVDAICFGTLAQRGSVSRQSLRALLADLDGTPAFYDVNLRQSFFTQDVLEWGFRRAQVVKVNDAEADALSRLLFGREMTTAAFAQEVHGTYGVDIVLVTLGADGCLVATASGVAHVPGHRVTVTDTIGAGDAFSAGFLSAWLHGQSPVKAATVGNALGAYVATQRGAVPPYSDHLCKNLSDLVAFGRMDSNNYENIY